MIEPEQQEEALGLLKEAAAEDSTILKYKSVVDAKKSTAAGNMFTDFTVVQDPENPEASTVKFSDYVGKGKYVLVDFWASWCGPCKMLAPVLHEFADEHAEVKVGKVNVDEEMDLAMRFGVSSIPTLILFKNGEAVKTSVGFVPKAQLESFVL